MKRVLIAAAVAVAGFLSAPLTVATPAAAASAPFERAAADVLDRASGVEGQYAQYYGRYRYRRGYGPRRFYGPRPYYGRRFYGRPYYRPYRPYGFRPYY